MMMTRVEIWGLEGGWKEIEKFKRCFVRLSGVPSTAANGALLRELIHLQQLTVQDGPLASISGFCDHTYRYKLELLWMSYQPVSETSTYTGQHNKHSFP
jgi:hypothetical protein